MKVAENRLQPFFKNVPQKGKIIRNRFSKTPAKITYLVSIALNPFTLGKSLEWKHSLICFWGFQASLDVAVLSLLFVFKH